MNRTDCGNWHAATAFGARLILFAAAVVVAAEVLGEVMAGLVIGR